MPRTIRLFGLVSDSIVDGPGFRVSIFTQGCPHHCPGCHNPESHDFSGGKEYTLEEIIRRFTGNPLLSGITLTGGEPFCQSESCCELAKSAHAIGLNVWIYSGWTYEQLLEKGKQEPEVLSLLEECDVLVDGRFLLSERSLDLTFRGSRNQRLIDLKATREQGSVALWKENDWC